MYDYVGGKEDWLAAGWPIEGHAGQHPTAGDAATEDVPTCSADERVGDLDLGHPAGFVLVVNEQEVVLGKVLPRHAGEHPDAPAGDVMIEGPTTVRASEDLEDLTNRMEDADTGSMIVTSKEGQLVGVLGIEDAYATLRGDHT